MGGEMQFGGRLGEGMGMRSTVLDSRSRGTMKREGQSLCLLPVWWR